MTDPVKNTSGDWLKAQLHDQMVKGEWDLAWKSIRSLKVLKMETAPKVRAIVYVQYAQSCKDKIVGLLGEIPDPLLSTHESGRLISGVIKNVETLKGLNKAHHDDLRAAGINPRLLAIQTTEQYREGFKKPRGWRDGLTMAANFMHQLSMFAPLSETFVQGNMLLKPISPRRKTSAETPTVQ